MRVSYILATALLSTALMAQQPQAMPVSAPMAPASTVTVPSGTHVMLGLIHPISTKNARVGDGVYLKSTFPVTVNNEMVIPPGTFVQGEITDVRRSGRVHGRAEVRFRFTTLIFPSGYTVSMPGAVENVPAIDHASVTDKEGTIKADAQKGKDAGTIATGGLSGASIGALSTGSLRGAAIGGGIGAAVGTALVLLTRGSDVRLEPGTAVEMVFERPLTLDRNKLQAPTAP